MIHGLKVLNHKKIYQNLTFNKLKLTTSKQDETKSVFFLLPLTLVPKTYFNNARAIYALNSHKPELDHHVFILFEKDKIENYEMYRFQNFNTYHSTEDFGEFVLITFEIPSDYHKDHKRFLKGKYSKFSEKAKNAIGNHFLFRVKDDNGKVVDSALFKVLFPKNEDRESLATTLGVQLDENCEIFDSPNLELETFNINNFYKLFE